MKRRTFIAGLGSAAAWPLAARAQQSDRVRRIGVLLPSGENDPVQNFIAFTQALADLGWTDGRNVRINLRWAGADINRIRASGCRPTNSCASPHAEVSRLRHYEQRGSGLGYRTRKVPEK